MNTKEAREASESIANMMCELCAKDGCEGWSGEEIPCSHYRRLVQKTVLLRKQAITDPEGVVDEKRSCETCLHKGTYLHHSPCRECNESMWEPK